MTFKKAKAITACGCFYDLEDPVAFIRDVGKALVHDGVFVAQLMCLRNMLNVGDIGNLCHEHLEFYTLKSLRSLYANAGLEIFDVETNDVNGQSYRIWARHYNSPVETPPGACERVSQVDRDEENLGEGWYWKEFERRLEGNRERVCAFLQNAVQRGKTVWGYGASTKGNVLLQYYGLDRSLVSAIADKSSEKWGKYTVGTGIPIVSEEEFRRANPDFALVLPYAFLEEFEVREKAWRDGGGAWIVPLPYLRVI